MQLHRSSFLAAFVVLSSSIGVSADYVGRCWNIQLAGPKSQTLSATCWKDNNRNMVDTQLDLNKCVANYGGNLACAHNGGFGGSCYNCLLRDNGKTFGCKCPGGPGGDKYVYMDLNSCLNAANGGKLGC